MFGDAGELVGILDDAGIAESGTLMAAPGGVQVAAPDALPGTWRVAGRYVPVLRLAEEWVVLANTLAAAQAEWADELSAGSFETFFQAPACLRLKRRAKYFINQTGDAEKHGACPL